jgi:putative transposase
MAGPDRMTVEEVVQKVLRDEHADVIRESVRAVAAELMEVEVSQLIGAERGERRPEDRATQRNGYRPRRWDTRAGEIELQIPKRGRAATSRGSCSLARLGAGAGFGGPAGLCVWRLDSTGRSVGGEPRAADLKVGGPPDRGSARCAGRRVSRAAVGGPLPLPSRRREDRESQRRRPRGPKCVVIAHAVHETGRREIIGLDVGAAETRRSGRSSSAAWLRGAWSACRSRSPTPTPG